MQNERIKMVKNAGLTLAQMYEQFQKLNKAKNLSPATINHYHQYYLAFSGFAGDSLPVAEIDEKVILGFVNHMQDGGIKDVSINTAIRAVRILVYYGIERGYIQQFRIHTIKSDKPIIETYTHEELRLLLRKPDVRHCSFAQYRNWVLVSFLVGCGARANTIREIRIADLDIGEKQVKFRHMKARKQLIVPLSTSLASILAEYLTYRNGKPDDYLFSNDTGGALTQNGLKWAVRRFNLHRGVARTSIHAFRHTYAKLCIMAGMDAFRLMHLMGHSNISTTQNYINLFGNDLAKDYDVLNPLENLIRKPEHIKL